MKYCTFLRGINVKGTNMKMAEVSAVFQKAGMEKVSTVLASGNIIFSSEKNEVECQNILEKAMSNHFQYEAFLFIRNKIEIENYLTQNPFSKSPDFHIYGFIGVSHTAEILFSEYEKSNKATGEEAQIIAQNLYWKIPKGNTLDSDFGKILGKKNLKAVFTSRNLNTFEKVIAKMG